MRRWSRTTAGAAAALGLAWAAAGCGARREDRAARPPERVVSIVQDDAELLHRSPQRTAATLDLLRDLGVDWVRVTAGWSVIAPGAQRDHRPPGFVAADPDAYPPHAWDALDRLHDLAKQRGLKLSIDVAFWAPRWAVTQQNADRTRGNERDGVDAQEFASFAEAVAKRYPDAAAYTIWNEPNHTAFLLPQWERTTNGDGWVQASARQYRQMLYVAVPRIKAIAKAPVLIGATSSVGSAKGSSTRERTAPLTFLRALACVDAKLIPTLDAPGCRSFEKLPGDGWSHHPYGLELPPEASDPSPDNVRIADLRRLTDLLHGLAEAGRTANDLPVYLTEFGYQTSPPDPTWDVTPAEQASYLARAEQLARANPRVRSTAQFLVRDLPERPGADAATRWRDYQSGLQFADGRAKPALAAYALPLVARRRGDEVAVWGLVRPGTGPRRAVVQQRAPGASTWTTADTWTTAPDGTFSGSVDVLLGSDLRLRAAGHTGAIVPTG